MDQAFFARLFPLKLQQSEKNKQHVDLAPLGKIYEDAHGHSLHLSLLLLKQDLRAFS